MTVIVDYGMGNLRSVQKGFEKVGSRAIISRDAEQIKNAPRLVLPGVGAFPECMKNLSRLNLIEPILEFIQSGRPFLGICLGLQLLFDESEEFGLHDGFKVIRGGVKAFNRQMGLKIPHMGWNQVVFRKDSANFSGHSGWFLFLLCSLLLCASGRRLRRGRGNGLRHHIYLCCGPGKYLRGSISSGKEPGERLTYSGQFRKAVEIH